MVISLSILFSFLMVLIVVLAHNIDKYVKRLKSKDILITKLLQSLPYLFVSHLRHEHCKSEDIDGAYCFDMQVRPEYNSHHVNISFFIAGDKRQEYISALYRYFSAVQITKDIEMHVKHLKDMDEVMIESRYEFDDEYNQTDFGIPKEKITHFPENLPEVSDVTQVISVS